VIPHRHPRHNFPQKRAMFDKVSDRQYAVRTLQRLHILWGERWEKIDLVLFGAFLNLKHYVPGIIVHEVEELSRIEATTGILLQEKGFL